MWRFVCGVADAVSLVVQQRRSRSGACYIVSDYVSTVLTCFSVKVCPKSGHGET